MDKNITIVVNNKSKKLNNVKIIENKTVENILNSNVADEVISRLDNEVCKKFTKEISKINVDKIQDKTRKQILKTLDCIKKSFDD